MTTSCLLLSCIQYSSQFLLPRPSFNSSSSTITRAVRTHGLVLRPHPAEAAPAARELELQLRELAGEHPEQRRGDAVVRLVVVVEGQGGRAGRDDAGADSAATAFAVGYVVLLALDVAVDGRESEADGCIGAGTSLSRSEHTVINLGSDEGPPRLVMPSRLRDVGLDARLTDRSR